MLQNIPSQDRPIYCYALDLLHRNGELLANLPPSRRRELLENLLAAPKDPLPVAAVAGTIRILDAVRRLGLEGMVSKRTTTPATNQASDQEVRHRWIHSRRTGVRCIARGRLREEGTQVCREGEERLRAADPG